MVRFGVIHIISISSGLRILGSLLFVMVLAVGGTVSSSYAQEAPDTAPVVQEPPKPSGAFLRSLVLPGWGHQYAQGGSWRGRATLFAGADVGLWIGLFSTNWREDHLVQGYQTLAATRAGADIAGKDRTFYLNLATYPSSDQYLSAQLRNRAWDRIDYVADPSFQWAWQSEDDFLNFRDMREDAESLGRRRSIFIALLVANRLLSGISSVTAANKARMPLSMAFSAPPAGASYPVFNATLRF